MSDYKINAKVTADINDFKAGMSEAQQKMQATAQKMQNIGSKMTSIGAGLTAGITLPVIGAGVASGKMASDYEENLNKVNVAFGESAKQVVDWSKTTVKNFGIANVTALDMASLFGDMGTSMGLPTDAAAKMSMSLTGLAGDLASFKNLSLDEVQTALAGVFTGETESLKRLGIVMTETNLEEFASRTGLIYKEMSQAEKVQLRYNYVMENTKNAQGDYARTADGTANSIRTFQESLKELGVTLGQAILPVITPIIQKMTEWANKFKELDPNIQKVIMVIAGIAAAVGPVLIIVGQLVSAIGSISLALGGIAIGPIIGVIAAIAAVVGILVYAWQSSEKFRNAVSVAFESILPILIGAGEAIKGMFQQAWAVIKPVLDKLGDIFADIILDLQKLKADLQPVIDVLGQILPPILKVIGAIIGGVIVGAILLVIAQIKIWIAVFQTVVNAIKAHIDTAKQNFQQLVDFINWVATSIANYFTTNIEKAKQDFQNLKDTIIGAISGAIETVKFHISVWQNFIGMVVDYVSARFNALKDAITGAISWAIDVAVSKFNWLRDTVWGVVQDIKNFFSGIGDAIGGAIGSAILGIKSMINDWIISPINNVIGALNSALGSVGVSISRFPYLARGTDNWQGGMAYINEQGRGELVNLPTGTQVIPHDLSKRMIDRYARYTADNNSGGGIEVSIQPNSTPVIINLDGKELARGSFETIYELLTNRKRQEGR